jgi:large subunit ribosomal protein L35
MWGLSHHRSPRAIEGLQKRAFVPSGRSFRTILHDLPGYLGLPGPVFVVVNKETKMPKLKTKSGVKKRFSMTATGKLKHGVAGKRHRLISHNGKYIRQNRGTSVLSAADTPCVKAWAPYGLK